jgi:hypothetical protein
MTSHSSPMCRGVICRACHVLASLRGRRRSFAGNVAIIAAFGLASSPFAQTRPSALQRIDRDRLCVTNGVVSTLAGDRLAVDTPSSRAVVQDGTESTTDQLAEIQFQYLGPSRDGKPLASGELRRQIGLKLQAQDSCNLIYAMWRIEPDSRVAVSIKRNAGLHTHEQCGAHGYVNFKSQRRDDLPPIRPGVAHKLRAELRAKELTVTADDKIAWQGSLGNDVALPVGPPGFRTDNARLTFAYFAATSSRSRPRTQQAETAPSQCVMSEGD